MRLLLLFLPFLMFSFSPKPTRIIFFGDSITEAGVRPGGYIAQMRDTLTARGKGGDYELIGSGIGGNKVYDLFLRLDKDVLEKKPDLVFIYVGVNDVWHKRLFGTGTDAPKFRQFYEAMIQKIAAGGARLVLCTPACIGERTDCSNPMDGELNQYSKIIRELATQYNCGICDLREVVMRYNAEHNKDNVDTGILTNDGVHLNEAGNRLVAQAMLGKL